MNAPIISDITATASTEVVNLPPHLIDFAECPMGTEWWPPEVALQAHVQITQLQAENYDLRAERLPYCSTCGARPCCNPSFCEACRREDQNRKRSVRR